MFVYQISNAIILTSQNTHNEAFFKLGDFIYESCHQTFENSDEQFSIKRAAMNVENKVKVEIILAQNANLVKGLCSPFEGAAAS